MFASGNPLSHGTITAAESAGESEFRKERVRFAGGKCQVAAFCRVVSCASLQVVRTPRQALQQPSRCPVERAECAGVLPLQACESLVCRSMEYGSDGRVEDEARDPKTGSRSAP